LLLLLEAVEQIYDDVSYSWQEIVEAGLRGFLAQRLLQYSAQQFRHVSEIVRVDSNGVEGARRDIEFIAQTHVDVRDLALGGGPARP
jgi:spore germination protein YaaH